MPYRHVDISKKVTSGTAQTSKSKITCEGTFFWEQKMTKEYFGSVSGYMPYGLISRADCVFLGVCRICKKHKKTFIGTHENHVLILKQVQFGLQTFI